MIINSELKDSILKYLLNANNGTIGLDLEEDSSKFGISYDVLDAILEDFEKKGFCEIKSFLGGECLVKMKVPASDFYLHGGFEGQEELLQKNIEKLLLEIEDLKPSMPDKISKITAIASNILTGLGVLKQFM
jgi:hypothetical protein